MMVSGYRRRFKEGRIFICLKYLFGCVGSFCVMQDLSVSHELSSCGVLALVAVVHGLRNTRAQYLLYNMWDLSSPIRDQIHIFCIARQFLNHWTTTEVPGRIFMNESESSSSLPWWEDSGQGLTQAGQSIVQISRMRSVTQFY